MVRSPVSLLLIRSITTTTTTKNGMGTVTVLYDKHTLQISTPSTEVRRRNPSFWGILSRVVAIPFSADCFATLRPTTMSEETGMERYKVHYDEDGDRGFGL
ncbi:uncharacterized protein CTRU02_213844 [Colletotrichum truncatum]|uniref:Uncharacterized protein n=1 Tax=Colletotrichum truncatum TaxID=5467 RepID=A0ACC3YGY3_COLTU|nr:uncharacterized protein CTRU02_12866 [Colletotrichum truncatum]KAF6784099.1 hypothetical protein CTRU02_12866 [Colletotrichum truncatum]